jgi:hypothetical protein
MRIKISPYGYDRPKGTICMNSMLKFKRIRQGLVLKHRKGTNAGVVVHGGYRKTVLNCQGSELFRLAVRVCEMRLKTGTSDIKAISQYEIIPTRYKSVGASDFRRIGNLKHILRIRGFD